MTGIYMLCCNNEILYIGKTIRYHKRMWEHFSKNKYDNIPRECTEKITHIKFAKIDNLADLELYETYLINKYLPEFNTKKKFCNPSVILPELKWELNNVPEIKTRKPKTIIRRDDLLYAFLNQHKNEILVDNLKDELIDLCNVTDEFGRKQKSISKITDYISHYDYMLSSKVITRGGRKVRGWLLESISDSLKDNPDYIPYKRFYVL